MASVAHATTKARKTNQMTARSQRGALDKPLRTDLSFPSAASAGRRPGSAAGAESGLIVMLAHSASKTRVKALVARTSTFFVRAWLGARRADARSLRVRWGPAPVKP